MIAIFGFIGPENIDIDIDTQINFLSTLYIIRGDMGHCEIDVRHFENGCHSSHRSI